MTGSDGASQVRTTNPNLTLPNNALYRIDTTPGNRYLVETDPQFANYKKWLSSDYMLDQIKRSPDAILKRLGDGYYEQQLIQQQIQQTTGQRYLAGYTSNEAQYMALMNAGVQMAKAFNYEPGIALSNAQMAQLTSDIVWMVKQTVTLADGSTQEVLAPQVYLRTNKVQVTGQGTLIAGNNVTFQTAQDIVNSGTIAARNNVVINARDIDNQSGRIAANNVALTAAQDIDNRGGAIDGTNTATLRAGRDIKIDSTTVDTANATTTGSNINRVASVTGGDITIAAARDISANAAVIAATGNTTIAAGRDVNLGTVNEHYRQEINWASDSGGSNMVGILTGPNFVDDANGAHGTKEVGVNRATLTGSKDVATQITGNNIVIHAGQDLSTQGTQVIAEGALTATAGSNINISTAHVSASARDQHQHSESGILSSTTKQTDDSSSYSRNQGSTFSGNTTVIAAGNNVSITGSDVVSTKGTQIAAGNDVTIKAATDTSSEAHYRKETTSGVFSSGMGLTVGSKMQSHDVNSTRETAAASTVGATEGNVSVAAGSAYQQTGSDILAPKGDIDIAAKRVDIESAEQTGKTITADKFKQQGVTVSVSAPMISALQTIPRMIDAGAKTRDTRMKALAAASAGMAAYGGAQAIAAITKDPKSAKVGVTITAGSSQSSSTTAENTVTQRNSNIVSAGDISIKATGGEEASNLTIKGSEINAGGNVSLRADNNLNLQAAQDISEQHSDRKSSSAAVGFAIEVGSGGVSMGVTANAAGSRGNSDGKDVANVLTHIKAANRVDLQSKGDTNLTGAVVNGKQVTADVGKNLNIASVQDTSSFHSKDESMGGSVTLGAGASGSVSMSRSKVDADYASVGEQSGINAGDGGFQVKVAGNSDLKGGKIASSDKAVDTGKNNLTTATLTISDIENRASTRADSNGLDLNSDMVTQGKYGLVKAVASNMLNNGSASDSSAGSTKSVISQGVVNINDGATQLAVTGKTVDQTIASLNRDVEHAHVAAAKLDVQRVEDIADANRAIKLAAFKEATRFSDEAYRKMFVEKARMYEVTNDGEGNQQLRLLSDEEKLSLKPGLDGKVHIANNGIFNDVLAAAKYADQHSTAEGPQYMIHFPEAGNTVSELVIAGYQKYLEGDVLGLTNATTEVRTAMQQYGQAGLHLDGHSRGSMTVGNAMESIQKTEKAQGALAATTINFYGPAYNAAKADGILSFLQNRDGVIDPVAKASMVLQMQNHWVDPVGGWIGGNPATGGSIPDGSNWIREVKNVMGGKTTVHNCYGGNPDCRSYWGGGYPILIPQNKSITRKVE